MEVANTLPAGFGQCLTAGDDAQLLLDHQALVLALERGDESLCACFQGIDPVGQPLSRFLPDFDLTFLKDSPQSKTFSCHCRNEHLLHLELRCCQTHDEAPVWHGTLKRLEEGEVLRQVQASERELRAMLNSMQDTYYRTNAEGRIIRVSPSVHNLLGYRASELIGRPLAELYILPEERERFLGVLQENEGVVTGFEAPLRHRDGGEVWVSTNAHYYFDEAGDVAGIEGITRDVTSRRLAEHRLRQSEQRLRSILHNIPMVVFALDRDGIFTVSDGKSLQRLGLVPEELVGSSIYELYAHDPGVIDAVRRALAGEAVFHHYGQNELAFDVWYTPMREPDGSISGVIGVASDVTERNSAEQRARETELHWTAAMDAIDDAVYVLDAEFRLLRANKAFWAMIGLPEQVAMGRPFWELMKAGEDHERCPLCRLLLKSEDAYLTLEADHPANISGRPVEISVKVMRDGDGEVVANLIVQRDLERVRQAEEALRSLNEHLSLLMESTGEGIFGVNRDLQCTFANHAAVEMLGFPREVMEGADMYALLQHTREDGSAYPRAESPLSNCVEEGRAVYSDLEILWNADGTPMPVQYSANPILRDGEVTGAVVVFRNIAETQAMERKMDYMATHDLLTGLINRNEFERQLESMIDGVRSLGESHVLCYLDLDQFKLINDTCGHVAGDILLCQLAAILSNMTRSGDSLARLGGDEFGLLLRHSTVERGLEIIRKLRARVRKFRFSWQERSFNISLSVGIVPLDQPDMTKAQVMSDADAACYVAKERGRDRVHIYQQDDADVLKHHGDMEWVARLSEALEQGTFELGFQAIVPLAEADSERRNYEVLLRMVDENGKQVPPGIFIPAAERYNLMPQVDRWVIRNTLAQLAAHPRLLASLDFVSINLCGHSLSDESFLDFVLRAFADSSVPAEVICFEVTETAAVAHLNRALEFIERLKALGCRFALDDFGSGVSSFAYLKNLPVDYLKVDGHFVRDIGEDAVAYAMVEAINQVGHVMGLKTIAEFVEDDGVVEKLREIGVDYAQGFRLGKPRPVSALEEAL